MEQENADLYTWHKIFDSEEEASKAISLNKSIKLEIESLEICLARTSKGLFAVSDSCPHLGDSLSRGTCNYLGEVVCPWHSYRFDLATGEETTGHGLQLRTFPVKVDQAGVFVGVPDK